MTDKLARLCVLIAVLAAPLPAQTWRGGEAVAIQANDAKGRPVANARVVFTFQGVPGETGPDIVATDGKGRAVLTGLAPGPWQVEVSHPDYLSYIAMVDVRRGKKPLVSASFLEAGGRSLSPVKVKFSKGDRQQASPVLEARRPIEMPPAAEPADPAPPDSTTQIAERAPSASEPAPDMPASPPTEEPGARLEPPSVEPETPAAPEPSKPAVADVAEVPEPEEVAVEPVAAAPPEAPATAEIPSTSAAEPQPRSEPAPSIPAERPAESVTSDSGTGPPPAVAPETPPTPAATPPPPAPEALPEELAEPAPTLPEEVTVPEAATPLPDPQPVPREEAAPVTDPPSQAVATEPAQPADEVEIAVEPEPEPPATSLPVPAAASTALPPPPDPGARVSSHSAGSCADCESAEWTLQVTTAAPARDPASSGSCGPEVIEAARDAMRGLSTSIQLELSGFLGPVANGSSQEAIRRIEADLAAPFSGRLASFFGGRSPCQIVALVLPKPVRFSRIRLAAADQSQTGNCAPGQACSIGDAAWLGNAFVERGPSATIVYSLFENRSTERGRRAILTAYYRPPNANWKPRLPAIE